MNVTGSATVSFAFAGFAVFLAAAALSLLLLLLLFPFLQRYALAHPNARSSHTVPTPQGGGIGVIVSTSAVAACASVLIGGANPSLWLLLAATVFIACVGLIDDVKHLPVLPRLVLQAVAIALAIYAALPDELRVMPSMPLWFERTFLSFAVLWFVNLVNFMDGIDWLIVAEVVPISAAAAFIGVFTGAPRAEIIVALALCGAIVGFAPLNRPVAKLFLGDVGSLAIGLLLAWLLVALAGRGHIAAALLLPLYFLIDATITLLRRAARGEPVWQAHRRHFYQRARERGDTVMWIVARIFGVNIGLVVLAVLSIWWIGWAVQLLTLGCGVALVAWLLFSFAVPAGAN
jgi:UDP-N-acetylmuramyl pentapeptide phosphotransferase/UDP-N-acetylglucosamine-1-phosphate transferase